MIPDPAVLRERLTGEGLSPGAADEAVRRLLRAAVLCGSGTDDGTVDEGPPRAGFFVPGRIELLGKHTDYAGGRSLVTALEAGISAVVVDHAEPVVEFVDTDTGARASFPHDREPDPDGGFLYPAIYLSRIRADLATLGVELEGGALVAWSSSLPQAAGMSSSSALLVTLHLALATRYRWAESPRYREHLLDREALAGYLAAVEAGRPFGALAGGEACRGVGSDGGSQDHTAILCARPGAVARYAFRPARYEGVVPMPEGWTFALASSGVSAPKAGSARDRYNRLAAQPEAIMDLWRSAAVSVHGPDAGFDHLGSVLEAGPGALIRLGQVLRESRHLRFPPEVLLNRAAQFADETGLHVPMAARALEAGELEAFGRSVRASHRAAVEALANDTPETEALTFEALAMGAVAASPFGAGFGGSVWALVREESSAEFLDRWRQRYLDAFSDRTDATFLRSRAGPPALRVF